MMNDDKSETGRDPVLGHPMSLDWLYRGERNSVAFMHTTYKR